MLSRQRITHVLTGLLLVAIILLSSTGASYRRPARSVVNLVMWQQWGGGHEKATLDKYIALFNRTHPTIHVTEIPVTDNTKIVAAISGGHPPDLMDLGDTHTIGEWAHSGLLQPLDNYIKSSGMDMKAFVPAGWNAVTFQGKHWGVPFMNFNIALVYNRTEFQQAGITRPPRTLEELDQDAAKLTIVKNGRIVRMGYIPDSSGGNGLEYYAWLFGGDWFKGNKSTAADPANVQALTWETTYYKKYGASNVTRFMSGFGQYLTAADGFESGKMAMIFDGWWTAFFAKENGVKFSIGAAPFPPPAAHPERANTSYLDTNPQDIPTGSPHPQEAFEFIKWETTNPQLCSEYAALIANLPHLKTAPPNPLFKDPNFQVFLALSNSPNAHTTPKTPISSQFATNLSNAEQSALLGKATPQQALTALQQTTQQELDSAH